MVHKEIANAGLNYFYVAKDRGDQKENGREIFKIS